ncbi:hypothetical protein GCM10008932_08730 [Alkalibacterium iburiense]|uniref:N-acetyltransferase domain-containing protein n=1 Tax=Alkalibacterium iburiense TaxID=290589 RepID=A0ABP3H1Z5_9LACT
MKLEVMQHRDSKELSERVVNAFYGEDTHLSKETLETLIRLLWLEESEAFNMTVYVLKEEEEVIGAFSLTHGGKTKISVSLVAKLAAAVKHICLKEMYQFAKESLETSRKPHQDELYIGFLAVKESWRGNRIGHQLMENILRMSKERKGISTVSLYVLKTNDRAKHLYEKFGFKRDSRHEIKDYYFMVQN